MTLRETQEAFAKDTIKLYNHILDSGYTFTYGEAYRTELQAWVNSQKPNSHIECVAVDGSVTKFPGSVGGVGINKSLHRDRLAVDVNIFLNGALIIDKKMLQPIFDYWEGLNPNNRAGGNFKHPAPYDAPHFERRYQ
jgi:hypothetical protein